jgi:hypothetical protein
MEMGHRLTEIGNKMRVVMNGDGSQKSVTKYELTRAKYELTRLDLITCKLFDTRALFKCTPKVIIFSLSPSHQSLDSYMK